MVLTPVTDISVLLLGSNSPVCVCTWIVCGNMEIRCLCTRRQKYVCVCVCVCVCGLVVWFVYLYSYKPTACIQILWCAPCRMHAPYQGDRLVQEHFNFIDSHMKSTAQPAQIFTILANSEQYCVQIAITELYQNGTMYVESTNSNLLTSVNKVRVLLRW